MKHGGLCTKLVWMSGNKLLADTKADQPHGLVVLLHSCLLLWHTACRAVQRTSVKHHLDTLPASDVQHALHHVLLRVQDDLHGANHQGQTHQRGSSQSRNTY